MAALVFMIGAVFGSFYLVLSTRLPKKEDIVKSRSRCDYCGKSLKWYNLIPIFSYIFQGGKCIYCHKKIDILNFIIEVITGLLFLICYLIYGLSYGFFISLIISSLVIIIFISDIKYMIILDSPLIVSVVLIFILKLYYFDLNELLLSINSGILLVLVMFLVRFIGNTLFKKDSLGGGDIKFAFLIGLIVKFQLGLIVLILSTFLALPYAVAVLHFKKNSEFPYGPFLAGALLIVFLFIDKFTNFILYLFN